MDYLYFDTHCISRRPSSYYNAKMYKLQNILLATKSRSTTTPILMSSEQHWSVACRQTYISSSDGHNEFGAIFQ